MRLSVKFAAVSLPALLATLQPTVAGANDPGAGAQVPAFPTAQPRATVAARSAIVPGVTFAPGAAATLRARVLARKAARTARADGVADVPVAAEPRVEQTGQLMTLSTGTGQLIRLPRPIANIFISNEAIADVQMKSPTQLYLFAKGVGETSIFATDRSGAVVWSSGVRVGNNIAGVPAMLKAAMPENDVEAVSLNGMILLRGTVLSPKDAEEAQRLVETYTGGAVQVLNRLKVATPQQVMLQVKIAEVSRSVARNIGVNILNRNGQVFLGQGTPGTISTNTTDLDPATGAGRGATIATFKQLAGTTLGIAGHAFGADFISTLQLYEQNGLVTTLAEPNLVALSGETATFLAGGEIPIPQSEGLGSVSVTFKQYGVSLAFTPTVLGPGRIGLRVRPEVSQISDANSVQINGFSIPAILTRRADTTVELGSGQSFVIGGLLQNSHNNNTNKAPILGDLPIIGALFRSNAFRKDESELMIVVTPYIVRPIDANAVTMPTDGYRSAKPVDRILLDMNHEKSTDTRPKPEAGPGAAKE